MKSHKGPNRRPPGQRPPDNRPPAPVAEVEAEIKAEIAAEIEAETANAPARSTVDGAYVADPDAGGDWSDPPPVVADPAAEVLTWLRGEFDDVNAGLRGLSNRLQRQEEAVERITGSEAAELNLSLAELEGSSAQLRKEAAILRDAHAQLAASLPGLVAEAVQSTVAATVDTAVAELRATVAQLGAALSETLPAAVADALAPTLAPPGGPDAGARAMPVAEAGSPTRSGGDAGSEEARAMPVARAVPNGEAMPGAHVQPTTEAVPTAGSVPLARAVPGSSTGPGRPGRPDASSPGAPTAHRPTPVPDARSAPDAGATESDPRPPRPPAPARVSFDDRQPSTGSPAGASAQRVDAADAADAAEGRDSGVTCVLPGVSVGPTLALGVSAALSRARLRRRRRRRAGAPAAGLFRQDPYAGELSRRLEHFALARRDLAWSSNGATPAEPGEGAAAATAPAASLVAAAESEGKEVAVDLAAGLFAVVGPDAHDTGRALVMTFLAATDPSSGLAVVTGDLLPPGPPFPGLERHDDLAAALERVEAEVVRRNGSTRQPVVVLVTSAVASDQEGRLVDLARRGRSVGVGVLVVGGTVPGATVVSLRDNAEVRTVVPPEGAPDLVGARMFGLGLGPAAELLDLLAAARTDADQTVPVVDVGDEPFPVLPTVDPAPIKVRVLGPYRIDVGGSEVRSGLRAKARELLAFYLLHPEGTTLDVATEALWPEADPGRGSEWFWTALGNLRSRLRGVTGTKSLKIIEREGDRYRIEPVFDVDLWRFQAALPKPGAGAGDPDWAESLQGAADLYGGELLAGVDWAWADVPREDLRRRAVDVLVSLAATRLVAGDVEGALDALSHAVEVDPVAEQLYRRIMRLHATQSRRDEVEATFRRLEARLGELGLQPTPESEQLVRELV